MDQSEVKHLPRTDYTPAVLDDDSKTLLKAAAVIEQRGLLKHELCNVGARFTGPVCALGALNAATQNGDASWGHGKMEGASSRLAKYLGRSIPDWNNAEDRTQAEVVATLRAVALGL